MTKEIQKFLEKQGFTLCIHERDFLVGESIPANIKAAINHSRRMIMLISRLSVIERLFQDSISFVVCCSKHNLNFDSISSLQKFH